MRACGSKEKFRLTRICQKIDTSVKGQSAGGLQMESGEIATDRKKRQRKRALEQRLDIK